MPGSPDTSASRPASVCTSPSRPRSRARSCARPTNVALGDSTSAAARAHRAGGRSAIRAPDPGRGSALRAARSSGPGSMPELLDEHVAGVLVRAQRVGLAARPVEGEHQQLAEPLADRVLLGEPLGLDRDRCVPTPLEVDRELGSRARRRAAPSAARTRTAPTTRRRRPRAADPRHSERASARKTPASSSRPSSWASIAEATFRSNRTASTCSGAMSRT